MFISRLLLFRTLTFYAKTTAVHVLHKSTVLIVYEDIIKYGVGKVKQNLLLLMYTQIHRDVQYYQERLYCNMYMCYSSVTHCLFLTQHFALFHTQIHRLLIIHILSQLYNTYVYLYYYFFMFTQHALADMNIRTYTVYYCYICYDYGCTCTGQC